MGTLSGGRRTGGGWGVGVGVVVGAGGFQQAAVSSDKLCYTLAALCLCYQDASC